MSRKSENLKWNGTGRIFFYTKTGYFHFSVKKEHLGTIVYFYKALSKKYTQG